MCLDQQLMVNPRKVWVRNGLSRVYVKTKCNKCAECIKEKQQVWSFRSYWQAQETWSHGGYRLFVTLTFTVVNRPKISNFVPEFKNSIFDFTCFDYEQYKRFQIDFKNYLKRKLHLDPEVVKNNFRFFAACEYGTSDDHDHAPHIHVMIDDMNNLVDPYVLADVVRRVWPYGRTDGVYERNGCWVPEDQKRNNGARDWFNNHVFYSDRFKDGINVSMYVSKYMVKQSSFQSKIDERMKHLRDMLFAKYLGVEYDGSGIDEYLQQHGWLFPPVLEDKLRDIRRHVEQFTRHSQHYGEYAMQFYDRDQIMEDNYFTLPTDDLKIKYPVSQYYIHKWFYEVYETKRGNKVWRLTDDGKRWKKKRAYANVKHLTQKYREVVDQISSQVLDSVECESFQSEVSSLMAGRDYKDLAEYELFYKGRMRPENESAFGYDVCFAPQYSVDDVITLDCLTSDPKFLDEHENEFRMIYGYNTRSDRRHFGGKFFTTTWLGSVVDWRERLRLDKINEKSFYKEQERIKHKLDHLKKYRKDGSFTSVYIKWLDRYKWFEQKEFNFVEVGCSNASFGVYGVDPVLERWNGSYVDQHPSEVAQFSVVDENSYYIYRDFDKVLSKISQVQSKFNKLKQDKFDSEERQKNLFKDKNIKYKKIR